MLYLPGIFLPDNGQNEGELASAERTIPVAGFTNVQPTVRLSSWDWWPAWLHGICRGTQPFPLAWTRRRIEDVPVTTLTFALSAGPYVPDHRRRNSACGFRRGGHRRLDIPARRSA